MSSFHLNPLVARWLRAGAGDPEQVEPPAWDAWLLQRMSRGEVVEVGGVLVDRAVLRQRFACVSDRCAPAPDRGRCRSCCADAFVSLAPSEDRRLGSRGRDLLGWLSAREPRLRQCHGRAFYQDEAELAAGGQGGTGDSVEGLLGLARPGGRCVFSQLDDRGRIRCHLHAYAKQARIDRGELQPVSCRLFPLIVVDCGRGRAVLTVVASHTSRLVSAYPAKRYPCLTDTSLPPLYEAMRGDLDWLFGEGFAKALSRAASRAPIRSAADQTATPSEVGASTCRRAAVPTR